MSEPLNKTYAGCMELWLTPNGFSIGFSGPLGKKMSNLSKSHKATIEELTKAAIHHKAIASLLSTLRPKTAKVAALADRTKKLPVGGGTIVKGLPSGVTEGKLREEACGDPADLCSFAGKRFFIRNTINEMHDGTKWVQWHTTDELTQQGIEPLSVNNPRKRNTHKYREVSKKEAVEWFARNYMPRVFARMFLAGANMTADLRKVA